MTFQALNVNGAKRSRTWPRFDRLLCCTRREGHIEIVRLLLRHGADLNEQNIAGVKIDKNLCFKETANVSLATFFANTHGMLMEICTI